ncbi:MAG: YIP1 family protein [Caulobacterales bacterium]|nr:YIP1 family protein [Caulobacterales bacterium]
MLQELMGRVQRLLFSPQAEWDQIAGETAEPQRLITHYVAPLAAIPAIATIIGLSFVGLGGVTFPLGAVMASAIVSYALAIAGVFVFAFIIDTLAPSFGARKDFTQAMKVAAYAPTAGWVAGIFALIPMLSILALIGGLYSLYLLFVGMPRLMKPPEGRATTYTVVSIVVYIVVAIVMSVVAGVVAARPTATVVQSSLSDVPRIERSTGASGDLAERAADLERAAESGDAGAVLSALAEAASGSAAETSANTTTAAAADTLAAEWEQRAADMEAAAQSGDLGAVLGALSGAGASGGEIVDASALRALAPERLVGLTRRSLEVESLTFPVRAVVLTAIYGDDQQNLTVKVTNSPMISAMMGVAGVTGAEYERHTDDGYEILRRDGETMILEEWSESRAAGRYGRSIGETFMVEANGSGVALPDLQEALRPFGERELTGLPTRS